MQNDTKMQDKISELISLAKECLSIVESSTMKDKEIQMLIESAVTDLKRLKIDVETCIDDNLIRNTIIIYVKAHFGDGDINKKTEYLKRYKANLRELQFSEEYKIKEEVDNNAWYKLQVVIYNL